MLFYNNQNLSSSNTYKSNQYAPSIIKSQHTQSQSQPTQIRPSSCEPFSQQRNIDTSYQKHNAYQIENKSQKQSNQFQVQYINLNQFHKYQTQTSQTTQQKLHIISDINKQNIYSISKQNQFTNNQISLPTKSKRDNITITPQNTQTYDRNVQKNDKIQRWNEDKLQTQVNQVQNQTNNQNQLLQTSADKNHINKNNILEVNSNLNIINQNNIQNTPVNNNFESQIVSENKINFNKQIDNSQLKSQIQNQTKSTIKSKESTYFDNSVKSQFHKISTDQKKIFIKANKNDTKDNLSQLQKQTQIPKPANIQAISNTNNSKINNNQKKNLQQINSPSKEIQSDSTQISIEESQRQFQDINQDLNNISKNPDQNSKNFQVPVLVEQEFQYQKMQLIENKDKQSNLNNIDPIISKGEIQYSNQDINCLIQKNINEDKSQSIQNKEPIFTNSKDKQILINKEIQQEQNNQIQTLNKSQQLQSITNNIQQLENQIKQFQIQTNQRHSYSENIKKEQTTQNQLNYNCYLPDRIQPSLLQQLSEREYTQNTEEVEKQNNNMKTNIENIPSKLQGQQKEQIYLRENLYLSPIYDDIIIHKFKYEVKKQQEKKDLFLQKEFENQQEQYNLLFNTKYDQKQTEKLQNIIINLNENRQQFINNKNEMERLINNVPYYASDESKQSYVKYQENFSQYEELFLKIQRIISQVRFLIYYCNLFQQLNIFQYQNQCVKFSDKMANTSTSFKEAIHHLFNICYIINEENYREYINGIQETIKQVEIFQQVNIQPIQQKVQQLKQDITHFNPKEELVLQKINSISNLLFSSLENILMNLDQYLEIDQNIFNNITTIFQQLHLNEDTFTKSVFIYQHLYTHYKEKFNINQLDLNSINEFIINEQDNTIQQFVQDNQINHYQQILSIVTFQDLDRFKNTQQDLIEEIKSNIFQNEKLFILKQKYNKYKQIKKICKIKYQTLTKEIDSIQLEKIEILSDNQQLTDYLENKSTNQNLMLQNELKITKEILLQIDNDIQELKDKQIKVQKKIEDLKKQLSVLKQNMKDEQKILKQNNQDKLYTKVIKIIFKALQQAYNNTFQELKLRAQTSVIKRIFLNLNETTKLREIMKQYQ